MNRQEMNGMSRMNLWGIPLLPKLENGFPGSRRRATASTPAGQA